VGNANGTSPLDNMRSLEHYLNDLMRGAGDTPDHLKGEHATLSPVLFALSFLCSDVLVWIRDSDLLRAGLPRGRSSGPGKARHCSRRGVGVRVPVRPVIALEEAAPRYANTEV
jgi:hypothetical protein